MFLILFPWPAVLALAVSLLAVTILAWQSRCDAARLRAERDQAIADGRQKYAAGHADGLALAYQRAAHEMETASRKAATAWDDGYAAGVAASSVLCEAA